MCPGYTQMDRQTDGQTDTSKCIISLTLRSRKIMEIKPLIDWIISIWHRHIMPKWHIDQPPSTSITSDFSRLKWIFVNLREIHLPDMIKLYPVDYQVKAKSKFYYPNNSKLEIHNTGRTINITTPKTFCFPSVSMNPALNNSRSNLQMNPLNMNTPGSGNL